MISENNQNQNLETFIAIKIDAENNETTLAISFDWIHEDVTIFAKITPNCNQNCSSHNLQHPCEAWKGAKHSPETDGNQKNNLIWHNISPRKRSLLTLRYTNNCREQHNLINMYNTVVKATMDLCLAHHHQNQEIRHLNLSYDI